MAKLPAHVAAFGIQEGLYPHPERPEMLVAGGHAGKLSHGQSHVNGCALRVRHRVCPAEDAARCVRASVSGKMDA